MWMIRMVTSLTQSMEELKRLVTGLTTGFYFGRQEVSTHYEDSGYIREYDFVARFKSLEDKELILIEQRNFQKGDHLEIMQPAEEFINMKCPKCLTKK